MDDIPFDGYVLWENSSYHTSGVGAGLYWADRMMDLSLAPVPSQVDSLDGFRFQIADADPLKGYFSTTWSTSDPSVATIDSNGTLHFVSWGTVSIYADISYDGSHMRLSHTIIIPEVSFPGFPNYSLSYMDPPTREDGIYLGTYTVWANALSSIDPRFVNRFIYHWGIKYNTGDTIQWTTSNSLTYFCNIPEMASARLVYFKVQYENQYSQSYSKYLRVPLIIGYVDGCGFVFSDESEENPVAQVKGEIGNGRYLFSCLGIQESFDSFPTDGDVIRRMLAHAEFVVRLKVLKPWGEEDLVLIPYAFRREDEKEWTDRVMTFIFREDL